MALRSRSTKRPAQAGESGVASVGNRSSGAGGANTAPPPAPISLGRVKYCLNSAEFWSNNLPRYANNRQQWADWFAILAGTLAAITGVAIWPALTDTSEDWAKWLVSAAAVLAALFALFPRVKNYGELANQARELASQYGLIYGQLMDLETAYYDKVKIDPAWAQNVVDSFEKIKAKKDSLRDLPDR